MKFEFDRFLEMSLLNQRVDNENAGCNLKEPLKTELTLLDTEVCQLEVTCSVPDLYEKSACELLRQLPFRSVDFLPIVLQNKFALW